MNKSWKAIPAVVPIVLVNAVSVTGQVMFWSDHLPWPFIACLGFALALESVAVYLAYHASLAERSQDSAYKLRLASYAFGLTIGILNGSHFLNRGHVTAASIGMGLLSASSPWLWAIQARRASRDDLKAKGLIDDRSVRLGLRWIFFPRTSLGVFRMAVWNGENNPEKAIYNYETAKENERIAREARELRERTEREERERREREERESVMTLETAETQADAIRIAIDDLGMNATPAQIVDYLASAQPRSWQVTTARVRQVKSAQMRATGEQERIPLRALPDPMEAQSAQ